MLKKVLFIILAFLSLANIVSAQALKSFTEEKFLAELKPFLEESNPKETGPIMDEFTLLWTTNKFSKDQKYSIFSTANTMLKKKMKAYPDFKNYVQTLISFAKTNQSDESFDAWQEGLDRLLQGSNRYFNSFINTCNNLFRESTLYSSISTKWKINTDKYTFGFDSLPKIIVQETDLTCLSKGDSSTIYKTKGVYYPSKELWKGAGGTVFWTRAGLSEDTVFAQLKKYNISVTGSDYVADSVLFFNKEIFPKPLLGRFNDKLLANTTEEKASYPVFDSYNKENEIKNIDVDVDYRGGFSQRGGKFLGSGSKEKNATLTFYKNKKVFIVVSARSFSMKPLRISSDKAKVKIILGSDSIYHPGLEMKLLKAKKELTFTRTNEGIAKSPFFSSFHQVDMFFEQLTWVRGDTTMDIKMISGGGLNKANFESFNYFKDWRYEKIQGIADKSPLIDIKRFVEKEKSKTFYTEDFAKYMHLPLTEVKILLISLGIQGFLSYDSDNDQVTINDKVYFYINSKFQKSDFDVIDFESKVAGKLNAKLSLNNYNLNIQGVDFVSLSDSQSVFIRPSKREIVLKGNRDFAFGGNVFAGRFEFYGKDFYFHYKDFKIDLNNVDSLRFKVPISPDSLDANGNPKLIVVKSVIEHITGNVLIDIPTNKSGRFNYPQYPIFNSLKESWVYYDRPSIFNGVYDRSKFFFHLDPFTIDSLDNFTAAGLTFNGELVSANIFPTFKDTLKLQKDYSLGFIRNTPEEGFPAYKGKGKYTSEIRLSNQGLRGTGTLDYLVSQGKSHDFMFFPDSTNGIAYDYEVRKEGVYPAVKAKDVWIHWMPYLDYMDVTQRTEPFAMYENQSSLAGSLRMAPKGLTGKGTVSVTGAELDANLFKFEPNRFTSDSANFRMKSDISASLAFTTNNVKSEVDMIKREGLFKANNPDEYVKLPINEYIAYLDQFKWLMDKKEIELGAGPNAPEEGYKYVSINSQQDSLTWNSPVATYRLTDNVIAAKRVKHIFVADGTVFPDSGNVTIEPAAKMRTLLNSKLTANNETKYHTIYNATINVLGRKKLSGDGLYDVVAKTKEKHTFHFTEIGVANEKIYASGYIPDSADYSLSPQIGFKGTVKMNSDVKFLSYIGFGKIKNKCTNLDKAWFKFESIINPDSVVVPINEFRDDQGNELAVAIGMGNDANGTENLAPMFLSIKQGTSKDFFISAKGFMQYDTKNTEFRISSDARLNDPTVKENYVSFNDSKCIWYGEGDIHLSNDFGQLKAGTIGNISYNLNNQEAVMNAYIGLNFYFLDDAWKAFAEAVTNSGVLEPTEATNKTFEKALNDLLGKERAADYLAELALYQGVKKLPKELENSLTLSSVKLIWNSFNKSFLSEGKIDVASIGKTQINRQMNGKVELIKRSGKGDILNIYLESDEFGWYYFSYDNDVMQSISSDEVYNDALRNVPEKETYKKPDEKGASAYQYMLSTEKKKNEFLRKVGYRPGRG